MEKKFSSIDKMDIILKLIEFSKLSTLNTLIRDLHNKGIVMQDFEVEPIVLKLLEDHYIYRYEGNKYAITIPGELFIQSGLYRQQFADLKLKRFNLRLQGLAVIIGGFFAASYYLLEILRYYAMPIFQYYCHCEFVWQK